MRVEVAVYGINHFIEVFPNQQVVRGDIFLGDTCHLRQKLLVVWRGVGNHAYDAHLLEQDFLEELVIFVVRLLNVGP